MVAAAPQMQLWARGVPNPSSLELGVWWHRLVLRAAFQVAHGSEISSLRRAEGAAIEVLDGVSPRDLDDALDELAQRSEIAEGTRALRALGQSPLLRYMSGAGRSPWRRLGPVVESYVEMATAYARHAVALTPELPPTARAKKVEPAELVAAVYNDDVPPEVSRMNLTISRGPACLFVLGAALGGSRVFAPWVTIDVAKRFMFAQRATLAAFALVGVKVSETLLPPEHRIDVDRAVSRHIARALSWERLPLQKTLPAN